MSGRIFQNIVLQFKETTDTVIGVIDSEGTVIACTDLPEIGQRWPHLVQPINEAEGACTALEGKTFKALEGSRISATPGTCATCLKRRSPASLTGWPCWNLPPGSS